MTEPIPAGPTRVLVQARRGRVVGALTWAYAALVLVVLGLIRWAGGGWWGVTVLLFAPRWLFLAPLAALSLASLWRRVFSPLALQSATAVVILGPLMGFNAPLSNRTGGSPDRPRVRVATYNLGMRPIPARPFLAWLDARKMDLVCFQEGGPDGDAVRRALREAGWQLSRKGTVASRLPIVEEAPPFAEVSEDDARYAAALERVTVRGPGGVKFVVCSVHLPTVRVGFERLFGKGDRESLAKYGEWWRKELSRVLTALAESSEALLLVVGDFNMPADDATMASLGANFRFAFADAGWGYGYTRPANLPWVRIDHVLASPDWSVTDCRVGPDFGSDHLPLWAELVVPE